jgi:threonyl-tRNA synthetase
MEKETASLRVHTQGNKGEVQVNEFLAKVTHLIQNKSLSVKI